MSIRKQIIALVGIVMLFSFGLQSSYAAERTTFRQDFYSQVEPIKLVDPLSFALGATKRGVPYIYQYVDIIQYSGHSCPSVAGAYKMTQFALKELYQGKMPIRGQIKVVMRGAPDDKVNGPIAQVISYITGAAGRTGFKGLKGKFSRYNLLSFESNNPPAKDVWAQAVFERMDTGAKVDVAYKVKMIPTNPKMGKLMPLMVKGKATKAQIIQFGDMWQERVRITLIEPPKSAFIVNRIK